MQVIKAENLSKLYYLGGARHNSLRDALAGFIKNPRRDRKNELWALKDVSFEIRDGETVGIIGRNGAGKSTLLKILSRITKPTGGAAEIRGRVGSLLEVGTGFHNELSGRENIFLNGAILGMKRSEILSKFDEIVAFSEVERFIDTPVKFYSSGMYMRLAFSVAAHLEPEILIVDEVLAVGDAEFQRKCLGKMDEVGRSGRTVLFVSHNLGSLAQICRRGLLLHKGELRSAGAIGDVIDDYLRLAKTEKQFKLEALDERKAMQTTEAAITDKSGSVISEVPHDEDFYLEFKVNVKKMVRGAFYCVALLNKHQERIFSEVRAVEDFAPRRASEISIKYKLPKNFIAPNNYSFLVQIFQPNAQMIDEVTGICPFAVVDTGSELSIYKDYGYVQMRAEWEMIED